MADSIFRRLVLALRDAYPIAAQRVSAPAIGHDAWRIGRIEAQQHKAPPYVAWIRGLTTLRKPSSAGPRQSEGQSVDVLADATQIVTAIICGRDEQEAEIIWTAVLNTVRDVFGPNPRVELLGTATWMTQEEGNSGYIHAGAEVVLQEFNWSIAIPRAIVPLTTITATEHDCEGIVP